MEETGQSNKMANPDEPDFDLFNVFMLRGNNRLPRTNSLTEQTKTFEDIRVVSFVLFLFACALLFPYDSPMMQAV